MSTLPSLGTFNDNERQTVEGTLTEALLRLVNITKQHHFKMMSAKLLEERRITATDTLSIAEKDELARYEQKRCTAICAIKKKTFARDRISGPLADYCRDFGQHPEPGTPAGNRDMGNLTNNLASYGTSPDP